MYIVMYVMNHAWSFFGDLLGAVAAVASTFIRFTAAHRDQPAYIWCTLANSLVAAPIYSFYRSSRSGIRRGIKWFTNNSKPVLQEEQ